MRPLVARRPVFESNERLFAYDIAVRWSMGASGLYEDAGPEHVIAQTFLTTGIDRIADGHDVIVTVNRDILRSRGLPSLPADRVIIQIPHTIAVDDECAASCAALVLDGHRLAVQVKDPAESRPLLAIAALIVIDATTAPDRLSTIVAGLRDFPARLLATNVRHAGERDACAALGFDLFEGVRFSVPQLLSQRDVDIEHLNAFRILRLLRDGAANDQEIEALIQGDVALSYKLLRMVSSAATGAREVWSIGHALRILGREEIARWLAILIVTDGVRGGVREELIHLALLRARMCELLADLLGVSRSRGSLFLVGMLSVLDQLLEIPMEDLCAAMDLAPELRKALIHRGDFFGATLRLVERYGEGRWADVDALCARLPVDPQALVPTYLTALDFANTNTRRGTE